MPSRVKVGDTLVAIRASDLGVDKGTRMHVVWTKGDKMDVDVPSLDARIAGIRMDHPDIAQVGAEPAIPGSGKTKAQIAKEIKEVLGKRRCPCCED